MREVATIVFTGSLDPDLFAEFVEHRARRLDLGARILSVGAQAMTVVLEGEPDLIDAFEMACSLGPIDCIVRDVERRAPAIEGAGP